METLLQIIFLCLMPTFSELECEVQGGDLGQGSQARGGHLLLHVDLDPRNQ